MMFLEAIAILLEGKYEYSKLLAIVASTPL